MLCQFEQLVEPGSGDSSPQASAVPLPSSPPDVSSVLPSPAASSGAVQSGPSDGLAASAGPPAPASRKRKLNDAAADEKDPDQDVECHDDLWAGVSAAARCAYTLRLHCVGCSCVREPDEDHRERLESLLGHPVDDDLKLDAVVDGAAQQWRAVQGRLPCQAKMAALHALFDPSTSVTTYTASDLPLPVLQQQTASDRTALVASNTFRQWSSQADAGFDNINIRASLEQQPKKSLEIFRQFGIEPPPTAAQLGNLIFVTDSQGQFSCITFEHSDSPSNPPGQLDDGVSANSAPTVVKVRCNCEPSPLQFFCPLAAGALKDLCVDAPSKVSFALVIL